MFFSSKTRLTSTAVNSTPVADLVRSYRDFLFNQLYNDYVMPSEDKGLSRKITPEEVENWVRLGRALVEGKDHDTIAGVELTARAMGLNKGYLEDQLKRFACTNGKRRNQNCRYTESAQFRDLAQKILMDRRYLDKVIPRTSLLRRWYHLRMEKAIMAWEERYFEKLTSPTAYELTSRSKKILRRYKQRNILGTDSTEVDQEEELRRLKQWIQGEILMMNSYD